MLERVTIRAADLAASQAFYATVLPTVGLDEPARWRQFSLAQASTAAPSTTRLHLAFAAPSRAEVHEFWESGRAAGYRDDGAPGLRTQYGPDYYGGFLLDPDGNSAEAVHYSGCARPGDLDHLWIRVSDLAVARRFYEDLAPYTGVDVGWENDDPPRVGFKDEHASFSLVYDGEPTRHAELVFSCRDAGAAEAFRRDHGGALRDPDGNVIEVAAAG